MGGLFFEIHWLLQIKVQWLNVGDRMLRTTPMQVSESSENPCRFFVFLSIGAQPVHKIVKILVVF